MAHRFSTDTIGNDPAVKLIGLRITREIPVSSTLWTMTWPDGDRFARDRFYLWLLERIDRWDDWSEMVTQDGARRLDRTLHEARILRSLSRGRLNSAAFSYEPLLMQWKGDEGGVFGLIQKRPPHREGLLNSCMETSECGSAVSEPSRDIENVHDWSPFPLHTH